MPSEKVETGVADHSFNTCCSEGVQENGKGAGRGVEISGGCLL